MRKAERMWQCEWERLEALNHLWIACAYCYGNGLQSAATLCLSEPLSNPPSLRQKEREREKGNRERTEMSFRGTVPPHRIALLHLSLCLRSVCPYAAQRRHTPDWCLSSWGADLSASAPSFLVNGSSQDLYESCFPHQNPFIGEMLKSVSKLLLSLIKF